MKEDFVTYEQAVKLKDLGFDWDTIAFYLEHVLITKIINWHTTNATDLPIISAPTLAQAQKWLREVKSIFIQSSLIRRQSYDKKHNWLIYDKDGKCIAYDDCSYDSYEQALSAGIDKALELLKENK